MNSTLSFTLRAVVALMLLVGFYAIAVGLAGLLLYLPYAEMMYAHRVHPKLALICLFGAFAIVKGMVFVPRPRFEAPGPQITEAEEPRLFALVREVAERMGTAMPRRIFLIPDVNAFVAEVGGFMGFGTERVMGIGVGLLAVDSVSELKATIAHEFGHYAGGDTRLGGVVYRTRGAIASVLESLSSHSVLSKPFEWYGALFLRVSHSVSRAQELAADRESVRIAGKEAHMSGLLREARGGVLFNRFMQSEVVPLHAHGFRPENVYQGFRAYHDDLERREEFGELEEVLKAEATDPYDTHPAFNDRLAYAEGLSDSANTENDRTPAMSILKHPERTEEALSLRLSAMIGGQEKAFNPVSWADVSAKVHAPKLSRDAAEAAAKVVKGLGGTTRAHEAAQTLVAALAQRPAYDLAVMLEPRVAELDADVAPQAAESVLVRTLGLLVGQAWVDAGGAWVSPLGRPFEVLRGKEPLTPFAVAKEACASKDKLAALSSTLALGEVSGQSHAG